MERFEYYCFDLDGTLLDSRKRIPFEALHLIDKLKNDGKHIIFASGRHLKEIKDYAEVINMSVGDFIISCDGQYIYDSAGNLLYGFPLLGKTDAIFLGDLFTESVLYISTDIEDLTIIPFGYRYILRKAKSYLHDSHKCVLSNVNKLHEGIQIEKIRIINDCHIADDSMKCRYSIHENLGQIDIQHKNVNKFSALVKLHNMGLLENIDSLLYFGNDINDLECFEHLKWTVAMGDTTSDLASKATFITGKSDENGIVDFFDKFMNNGQ